MPYAAVFWIVILLVRLLFRAADDGDSWNGGASLGALTARGKLIGHEGPNVRAFSGRAGRREWWLITLLFAVMGACVTAIPVVGFILALPWTIGGLAVTARRLHDLNRSAWWQVLPAILAAVCLAAAAGLQIAGVITEPPETMFAAQTAFSQALLWVVAAPYLVFFAWMGFIPGKPGPNCYGEADPAPLPSGPLRRAQIPPGPLKRKFA